MVTRAESLGGNQELPHIHLRLGFRKADGVFVCVCVCVCVCMCVCSQTLWDAGGLFSNLK